jgi:NADPH:quinone reductase-like Zn-dependent oxidoreductase
MLKAEKLRVPLCARYPFEQIADAHQAIESRPTYGNVILDVQPE